MAAFGKFAFGSLIGVAAGAVAGLLFTPGSADEVRAMVRGRLDDAKTAGDAAQADVERQLEAKYRLGVNDPSAFTKK